jgi:hypothetical protein
MIFELLVCFSLTYSLHKSSSNVKGEPEKKKYNFILGNSYNNNDNSNISISNNKIVAFFQTVYYRIIGIDVRAGVTTVGVVGIADGAGNGSVGEPLLTNSGYDPNTGDYPIN